jgi:hypothetical protein
MGFIGGNGCFPSFYPHSDSKEAKQRPDKVSIPCKHLAVLFQGQVHDAAMLVERIDDATFLI